MTTVNTPLDVRCPYCGVHAGKPCRTKGGIAPLQSRDGYHAMRLAAFDVWFMEMTQS